jgi:hypothetical protein
MISCSRGLASTARLPTIHELRPGRPTHAEALEAARTAAAADQRLPGYTEVIEYEDEKGRWHTETASGHDRPETEVQDTND